MKFGASDIAGFRVGADAVSRIYLGATEVWSAGGAAWTPADLGTNVGLWVDAADASTLTYDGSSRVSQWRDKSGLDNHLNQGASAQQPVYSATTYNGLPGVAFANDCLIGPAVVANTTEMGLYLVYREDQRISATGTVFSMNDGFRISAHMPWGSDGNFYVDTGGFTGAQRYSGPWGAAAGTERLVFVRYSVANSIRGVYVDGATSPLASIASGANVTPTNMRFGWLQSGSFPGYFTLSEAVITRADLALADRQRVEGYLAHKWGLAGSLPVGHPYKDAAP